MLDYLKSCHKNSATTFNRKEVSKVLKGLSRSLVMRILVRIKTSD